MKHDPEYRKKVEDSLLKMSSAYEASESDKPLSQIDEGTNKSDEDDD